MVGLDLVLGLSMVRRCSLNLSFKRRLVTAVTLNHVNKIFSVTGQVRFDSARFTGRKESIASKSV